MVWTRSQYESLPGAAEARRQLGLENKLTVGFTGHIYPGRGAELLFELAKRMPDVNFLWVGGTPDEVAYWRDQLAECRRLERDDDRIRGKQPLAALPVCCRCAADAVWTIDLGFERAGYCRSDQPDEDVRLHGGGTRDYFGGFAGHP